MNKWDASVQKIRREKFRDYAKKNYEWPDDNLQQQFDEAVRGIRKQRDTKYANEILKRYPENFVGKIVEWMRGKSELEVNSFKTFEDAVAAYGEEHPDRLSSKEIGLLFDESGKMKKFAKSPDDEELDINRLYVDEEGCLQERPPAPQPKTAPTVPTREQAAMMTSKEIAKYLSMQEE